MDKRVAKRWQRVHFAGLCLGSACWIIAVMEQSFWWGTFFFAGVVTNWLSFWELTHKLYKAEHEPSTRDVLRD